MGAIIDIASFQLILVSPSVESWLFEKMKMGWLETYIATYVEEKSMSGSVIATT